VLVGTNVGARRPERAKRIAFAGAAIAASACLAIGAAAALFPRIWIELFSSDAAVLEAAATYLRIVAPFYPFVGLAVSLYFAAQGAGQVAWPVAAGTARLAIVAGGGFATLAAGAPLWALFAVIALGLAVWGSFTAIAVRSADWSLQR